jgi:hypothetical protein
MYITTLHYGFGKTFIDKVDDDIDAEEFVSENYGLDETYYMTTNELNLEVNND